ncbi:MAG: UbiA family prenyltransferase, partial [Candidatus Latescibacteria bacterium]|nr:UbiA family prenyltransferase [Candidatus Latescibacterota bacterium]
LLLTAAVLTWTAGFDVVYSCQDYDFDVKNGLFSVPQRLGIRKALFVARLLHVVTVICLLSMAWVFELNVLYLIGVSLVAIILLYEHTLVSPDDLSKVNLAFFTTNGIISVVYLLFTVGDVLVTSW